MNSQRKRGTLLRGCHIPTVPNLNTRRRQTTDIRCEDESGPGLPHLYPKETRKRDGRRDAYLDWTGLTGLDWTGQDRTGQDRTGQDRTGQDRTVSVEKRLYAAN